MATEDVVASVVTCLILLSGEYLQHSIRVELQVSLAIVLPFPFSIGLRVFLLEVFS